MKSPIDGGGQGPSSPAETPIGPIASPSYNLISSPVYKMEPTQGNGEYNNEKWGIHNHMIKIDTQVLKYYIDITKLK